MENETIITLSGRIDSMNAVQAEETLLQQSAGLDRLVLDAAALEFISSAGLRMLLRLRKQCSSLRIVNLRPEVYEIFDVTGFTQIMDVERAYRSVCIDGCEEIGHGANGSVYRLDPYTVVKVYRDPQALDAIRHEREMAQFALLHGVPTAISYDLVRVGEQYGTVFELLNAESFSSIIARQPERLDWCVREFTSVLRTIHGTKAPAGKLPDMKQTVLSWVDFLRDHLPPDAADKLRRLVEAVPQSDCMLHGDYHTKNLELQNGETLIIDMDTLASGDPVFELGSIFNSFVGFYELDPGDIERFQGFSSETARRFWKDFLAAYLDTRCEAKLREVEDKARVVGYARLIRRAIRRGEAGTESGRLRIEHWKRELLELLEQVDSLCFSRDELTLPAKIDNLAQVQAFVAERIGERCSGKTQMQIDLAVEEIFVNIASYAYAPGEGTASLRVERSDEPAALTIRFLDRGVAFDPLAREDPDVNAMAHERKAGGLGIFLTKQFMDEVRYERRDGCNVLTIRKSLSPAASV